MAKGRGISPAGRVVLIVGAGVLLYSLFFAPWFIISGTQAMLPAGEYDARGVTELLNNLAQGPYAWAAFGWLIVVAIAAIAFAGIGSKRSSFGTSGILVLVLYSILLFVAANLINQGVTTGAAGVAFAFGFFVAVVGSFLIELGSRLRRSEAEAPMETTTAE